MEKWDAYDNKLNVIPNIELIRGENIPEGIYHLVGEVIVKHKDGSYLIMQRDYNKHYGGKWELTAGGSALKGETSYDCAKRELKEETGITSNDLQELTRVVHYERHSIYVIYLCVTDWNKNKIQLQDGETIDYKWVSEKELFAMSSDEMISYRAISVLKTIL